MELHGFHRQLAVPHAHDDAVVGFRGDFEAGGKVSPARKQRMIAAHLETLGKSLKDALRLGVTQDGLPCIGIIQHAQFAAECLHHALQAQAHAEHRNSQA